MNKKVKLSSYCLLCENTIYNWIIKDKIKLILNKKYFTLYCPKCKNYTTQIKFKI